jgi:ribosomal protein S18 acetylase RimI-like enzyme
MSVKIRAMKISDYENVYRLWLDTPGMGLNDVDDSRAGVSKYLKRNPNTCFVAEDGGGIIGVILCGHDGRRGYIYHAAVKVSERKKGVGTALVENAMNALEKEGISKTALVVFTKNGIGNDFWERRGFTARNDLAYRDKSIRELRRIDT